MVVIAQDHDDLKNIARKLTEEYRQWDLVNIKKTKRMCIGDEQEDGVFFRNCQQYRYLGVKMVYRMDP